MEPELFSPLKPRWNQGLVFWGETVREPIYMVCGPVLFMALWKLELVHKLSLCFIHSSCTFALGLLKFPNTPPPFCLFGLCVIRSASESTLKRTPEFFYLFIFYLAVHPPRGQWTQRRDWWKHTLSIQFWLNWGCCTSHCGPIWERWCRTKQSKLQPTTWFKALKFYSELVWSRTHEPACFKIFNCRLLGKKKINPWTRAEI